MPLASIVVIVLRLYCVNLFVRGATLGIEIATYPQVLAYYLLPAAYVVIALVIWLLAPFLARMVTRGYNQQLEIGSLSNQDLYVFAFVFLGLATMLASVGALFGDLYFYIDTVSKTQEADPLRKAQFHRMVQHAIPFACGAIALVFSNRWAAKILALHSKGSFNP